MLAIDRNQLHAPARVIDIDLSLPLVSADLELEVGRYKWLWCLARWRGIPDSISFWDLRGETTIRPRVIADLIGMSGTAAETAREIDAMDAANVDITVVICTHERPDGLSSALASLAGQRDPGFRTIVVDNAPKSRAAARVVADSFLSDCDYLIEPQKGLSRARNTALAHVATPYIAWMDDDEVADADWVMRIKQGFAHSSSPAAVCGVMLPAELETEAQIRFEQYGGFNKGRGLTPEALTLDSPTVVSPLYPLPAIGSGGNMAFRTDALRAAGGFDPALGAGTKTHGGEETKVFCSLLRSGELVLHWPIAITWHTHPRRMEDLRRQFYGYSAGLSAFYASLMRSEPSVTWELVRLLPHALRDLGIRGGGLKFDQLPGDFPKTLLDAGRRGLLAGGFSYISEVVRNRAGRLA